MIKVGLPVMFLFPETYGFLLITTLDTLEMTDRKQNKKSDLFTTYFRQF